LLLLLLLLLLRTLLRLARGAFLLLLGLTLLLL
jgi:hypothetical protein